jgi:peptidoglycan/xylan/chitin deacetylase (PgdA/CDA1 family)
VRDAGWEVIAKGLDMDHLHHGALPVEEERALIARTLEILRPAAGGAVRGWLSPAKSESHATPDLVAEAGLDYLCDWVNDDMPYAMRTVTGALGNTPAHYQQAPGHGSPAGVQPGRGLVAMPHPIDLDDHTILVQNHHTEDDFRNALTDQFDLLYREATPADGRIMAIALHPWVIGQPYRIGALEQALEHIMRHRGVWAATGAEIVDAWKAQQA